MYIYIYSEMYRVEWYLYYVCMCILCQHIYNRNIIFMFYFILGISRNNDEDIVNILAEIIYKIVIIKNKIKYHCVAYARPTCETIHYMGLFDTSCVTKPSPRGGFVTPSHKVKLLPTTRALSVHTIV